MIYQIIYLFLGTLYQITVLSEGRSFKSNYEGTFCEGSSFNFIFNSEKIGLRQNLKVRPFVEFDYSKSQIFCFKNNFGHSKKKFGSVFRNGKHKFV